MSCPSQYFGGELGLASLIIRFYRQPHAGIGNYFGETRVIELYTWTTSNGRKIPIMLEESSLDYRIHWINISKREQFAPDFLKISPNNKIPAIVDTDGAGGKPISIFESGAILLYLARKSGRFLPADTAGEMGVLQWLFFQMAHVGPTLGQVNHFHDKYPNEENYAKERFDKEAARVYGVIDRRLAEADYLGGDYSIADMAHYPWLQNYKKQGIDIARYPNVQRWMAAIEARPAVQRVERLIDAKRKANQAAAE
jgi:GST-like protein